MATRGDHVWTDADDDYIRKRWPAGDSTSSIAKALGVSKNAVVGRKKRIGGLDARPTVENFRRHRAPAEAKLVRPIATPPKQTLPPMPIIPLLVETPSRPLESLPRPLPARGTCCWLSGDKPFRHCDKPALFGKPYCEAHCAIAYVRRTVAA